MALTKENVKLVLRSIFVVPFIAGNDVPYDEFHAGFQGTDGSLSSTVTIACLTAVSFVIIGVYSSSSETDRDAFYIIFGFGIPLLFLGMIALGLMTVFAYKNRSNWLVNTNGGSRDWNLKSKFLWLFGLAVLFDALLIMAFNMECIAKEQIATYHVAFISHYLIYILFYITQMVFLSYARDVKFESNVRINYCFVIVLLVNLCLWFNSTIMDADIENEYPLNKSNVENSTVIEMQCIYNSTVRKFRNKIIRYIVPARIEATLLAISFLLSMWPSIRDNRDSKTFSLQVMSSDELSVADERTSLLRSSFTQDPSTLLPRRKPASFFASLLFGISINLVLVVVTLVFVFTLNNAEETRRLYPLWISILISYRFSMIVMVGIIFYLFAKHGKEGSKSSLTGNDYILIFSSAGAVASYMFDIIASSQIPENESTLKGLILTESALDIIMKYSQTVMIISFKKSMMRKNTEFISLKYVYLLLFVANFLLWFGCSFVRISVRDMNIPGITNTGLFGKDRNITSFSHYVLNPMIIYYNFHASMELFEMYMRQRHYCGDERENSAT